MCVSSQIITGFQENGFDVCMYVRMYRNGEEYNHIIIIIIIISMGAFPLLKIVLEYNHQISSTTSN